MTPNEYLRSLALPGERRLEIISGDLLEDRVDAIVNAANSHLLHGGGVAGAIVRKGGVKIQEESNAWVKMNGPVNHARPAYTGAGGLPFKYIIHTVGPVWGEGGEDSNLSAAVYGALQTASELGLQTLALPAISTGIFAFPAERAARIHLDALKDFFAENPNSILREIHLVLFDRKVLHTFLDVVDES